MTGSKRGDRIEIGFIDFDSRIDERHTGVAYLIPAHHLSPLATDSTLFLCAKKTCFSALFFAAPDAVLEIAECA